MAKIHTRDGTKLYVKDWGTGRPVILMHGWPLSADSFDDQAKAIADAGMRAISYDRRGFGRSDQPFGGYDYDTFADDLSDVMTATGATEDVALVGFSMGGGEVARYMSRHGGRGVTQAAFVASVVPHLLKSSDNPDGLAQADLEQMTAQMKADRADFFRTFFKSFYGIGLLSHPVSQAQADASWNVAMQAGLQGTLKAAEAFGTTNFLPDLPSITVPTLIIHGTADATVPIDATARPLAKALPNATLIEYDGAPHGLFASHKDRFTADLLSFLQRGSSESAFSFADQGASGITGGLSRATPS
jgi:pimeloyl-ACP methyl ester carboxylesterase